MSSRTELVEKLRWEKFSVLDDGFVCLVDVMGDDSSVVQAARVSYGEGTTSTSRDKALIDYLVRHKHTSPLEQVVITVHAKMPIFVARQWVRHRTARLNELSGRYSEMVDEFYVPEEGRVLPQDTFNIQGSDEQGEISPELRRKVVEIIIQSMLEKYCLNVMRSMKR